MTAVAVGPGLLGVPYCSATADTSTTLDATTDYICWVVQAPTTGTIDKVYVRLAATTLVGTLSCRIYNLDSVGDPDTASVYGSCAQSDYSLTGTDDNTYITFGSLACSATAGDKIAVYVWVSAITSGTSCNIISHAALLTGTYFPYLVTRTTGTGAGTKSASAGVMTLEYSGATYHDIGMNPASVVYSENLDSDGAIRRAGNLFTLPAPVTVSGAWAIIDNDTDTTTVKLYDTDGTTVLATATLVAAQRIGTGNGWYQVRFDSGTEVALSANTGSPYRIVVETNNTSATAVTCRGFTTTAAHMAQMPMGAAWYYTSHNGTSWTDTSTKRMTVGLLVSKFDDGAGGAGGGLMVHPGMSGGMRG